MAKKLKKTYKYTLGEEIFSAVSHGIGAVAAVAALVTMIFFAHFYGNGMGLLSAIIYGLTLILLYVMSTLYHSFTNAKVKKVFRIFDHCSIFLLIAGTYTPVLLVSIGGSLGFTLFSVIWGAAILGLVLNAVNLEKFAKISVLLYLIMGWAAVFAFKPLLESVDKGGLILFLAGGLAYTLGVIFYVLKKFRYMHSIWHLFVLAGSITHFLAVLLYVLPVDGLKS